MIPYQFAIVGAGWRAEFYLRISAALPERFRLLGVVVRNDQKAGALAARWGCPTWPTPAALLKAVTPEFWVSSVAYAANYEVNRVLVETGLPLLSETPPAATLEEMRNLWALVQATGARAQVAEQFCRQPLHAARLAAIRAGRIGVVHTAAVSVCHGYHGTSLIRHFLGVGAEEARIVGMSWRDRLPDPGGRDGPPPRPGVIEVGQQVALLDFGGRQAIFDFAGGQYFSPVRAQRVAIRGDRGEIVDQTLRAYNDAGEPVALSFRRQAAGEMGNLEGFHLAGIQLGETWVYRNPTLPARLSDEEIAMADLLAGMGEFVRGGTPIYPLADAMQDHYLGLCLREAGERGHPVTAHRQPWAEYVRGDGRKEGVEGSDRTTEG
jgi:predicted dehydrogenase